jgi:hypothetical protein
MQSSGFDTVPGHVRLVVDSVTLAQGVFGAFSVFPVSIIPPMLHIHFHIYVLLVPEAQKIEAWEPSRSSTLRDLGSIR